MDETAMTEAVQRIYTRNYSTIAATGILLADYLATYEVEFAYVWKRPITPVKITFILARYWAIVGQGITCYISLKILSPDRIPIDEKVCWRSMCYLVYLAISLHLISDSILVRRVVGLYNYHRLVRYGLVLVLVTQMLVLIIATQLAQPRAVRSTACDIETANLSLPETAITSITVLSHSLIWFITTSKRRVSFSFLFPFTNMSLRDGAWAAIFYTSIFLSATPYSLVSNSFRAELQLTWPTTLISIMTCRLILNTPDESLDDDVAISSDIPLDNFCDTPQSQDTTVNCPGNK